MSVCSHCNRFSPGDPCHLCRTAKRIFGLVKHLHPLHEGRAIAALRDCAGILSDLAEESASLPQVAAAVGLPAPSAPGGGIPVGHTGPDPGAKAKSSEAEKEAKGREKPPSKEEEPPKKDKKKKAKSRDKDNKKAKDKKEGNEETKSPVEKKESGSEEELGEETLTADSREEAERKRREDRQEAADRGVEENPEEHGLTRIPVRGSASRHFDEGIRLRSSSNSLRPPEPDHPPRREEDRSHGGERRETRGRSRSREKSTRWKGYKHYLRGAKAKAKAVAKAAPKLRLRRPAGRLRPRLRRPAAAGEDEAGQSPLEAWKRGEIVELKDLPLDEVLRAGLLVVEEGTYYMGESRVAGVPKGTLVSSGHLYIQLKATGTTNESILRLQSGAPALTLRLHWCDGGCNAAESAEDLIHVKKVRMSLDPPNDEGWINNLEKVQPVAVEDELAQLRAHAGGAGTPNLPQDPSKKDDGNDEKEAKKRNKKDREDKEKDRKEGKEKKKKDRKRSGSETSEEDILSGRRPRAASLKTLTALYAGTGLDPKERIRAKVAKSAKRSVKRKEKKKSSSSRTSEESSLGAGGMGQGENFFLQASRAKSIAESHPGALTNQTLSQMKSSLLQEAGVEAPQKGVDPVAMQYFRTVLARKGTGPMMRELLTLSACVDALLRAKPCHALDLMTQRMKAVESTLSGVHWSVSQRLELLPQELQGLAPSQEVREAQKEAYTDQKTRLLAGQPDGRMAKGRKRRRKEEGRECPEELRQAKKKSRDGASRPAEDGAVGPGGTGDHNPDETHKVFQYREGSQVSSEAIEEDRTENYHGEGNFSRAPFSESNVNSSSLSQVAPSANGGAQALDYIPTVVYGASPVANVAGGSPSADFEPMHRPDSLCGQKIDALPGMSGMVLGRCGAKLFQFFLEVSSLRGQYTGKRNSKSVFPLPTSRNHLLGSIPEVAEDHVDWLLCVVVGLNSYWGCELFCDLPPNVIQLKCLRGLYHDVKRFCAMPATVPLLEWDEFLRVKNIDYKGDEVQVARWFKWDNVGPALPGRLRGEVPEPIGQRSVLSIGLFDGISALRVALDVLQVQVIGHVSVECQASAQRVVESHFPGTLVVDRVQDITKEMVRGWAQRFSQCNLVVLGAGPPCQGVSGLNSDRRGALRDERSSLFVHVPRVRDLLRECFPWAQVHTLMESVASMDGEDRETMSSGFGAEPYYCDAGELTWCNRPRLYWLSWELVLRDGFSFGTTPQGLRSVHLQGSQQLADVTRAGWEKVDTSRAFPTFTTSRPREFPGRKPAGVQHCSLQELEAWVGDRHRFPPYQYQRCNCLTNAAGEFRLPDVAERELMLGFPLNYTATCSTKQNRKKEDTMDTRLTLLGNSWSVPVVACLLVPLLWILGFSDWVTPQEVVDRCRAGASSLVQGRLVRLPLNPVRGSVTGSAHQLAFKLCNLVSIKGEDVMINAASDRQVKFQRLRASVPAKLWRWRVVAGWQWTLGHEHINSLELRAILTTIRWKLEHQHEVGTRLVHLTDSMVCLHALSRGRSSSRKLRRTLARVNALTLAGNLQPVWAYVHTDANPADRPSRWGRRVKSKFRHAKA
eukprot:Skav215026  [mRNA]  locus=scaffold966:479153:485299:- [translate_table: standard]